MKGQNAKDLRPKIDTLVTQNQYFGAYGTVTVIIRDLDHKILTKVKLTPFKGVKNHKLF